MWWWSLFCRRRCAGLGGDSEDGDTKDKDEEAERERLEAIKEAEDRRKEKHRKMEEEREKMRQDIRDKVSQSLSLSPCLSIPKLWKTWVRQAALFI